MPARAADGTLTMLASGSAAAFDARPQPCPRCDDRHAATSLGSEAGQGAAFKMVNQLLAGVHIAAACEAIAFAARQGLDLARVYEVITKSAGNSWMFENRIPHVLDGDYSPKSAINDLHQGSRHRHRHGPRGCSSRCRLPVRCAADVSDDGGGRDGARDDDASVARLYAQIAGPVKLPSAG